MAFDVEQYVSLGPGERMAIDRMRALAMLWLNERLALFSVLSADDGEWPLQQEHETCASAVAFMGELIERMEHEASCMTDSIIPGVDARSDRELLAEAYAAGKIACWWRTRERFEVLLNDGRIGRIRVSRVAEALAAIPNGERRRRPWPAISGRVSSRPAATERECVELP